jgi:hypothetical protein
VKPGLTIMLVAVASLALTAGCGPDITASGPDSTSAQRDQIIGSLRHNVTISVRKTQDTMTAIESASFVVTSDPKHPPLAKGTLAFGEQLAAAFTVPGPIAADGKETRLDARALGTALYTEIPKRERARHEGRSWIRSEVSRASGEDAPARYLGVVDPLHHLRVLLGATNVAVTGPEEVAETTTVRYSATVPLEAYLSRMEPSLRTGTERYLVGHEGSEVRVEVWVDTRYQTRRCRLSAGDVDLTVNYREFGKSVIVKAPPPGDTVEAPA